MNDFWQGQNASGAYYYPNTITTTGTTLVTNLPQMPMQVGYAPALVPEDEMGWLRRRVNEITELVAA